MSCRGSWYHADEFEEAGAIDRFIKALGGASRLYIARQRRLGALLRRRGVAHTITFRGQIELVYSHERFWLFFVYDTSIQTTRHGAVFPSFAAKASTEVPKRSILLPGARLHLAEKTMFPTPTLSKTNATRPSPSTLPCAQPPHASIFIES